LRIASRYSALSGLIVAVVFTARAAVGLPSAWSYAEGRAAERAGRYAVAGPMIDRGAIGANRADALWRAGRTRLELWETLAASDRGGTAGADALRTSVERFLAGRVESPGSAWFVAALGDAYARRERGARIQRVPNLATLARGPWALVGDDGRIAIGLARAAIEREPSRSELRDQLVLVLESNGLHTEALEAMAESARVLPDFGAHPQFSVETLPRDLVETFWRASQALDPAEAPLLERVRFLLSLGQLGRRLGHLDEAEHDLRAALHTPASKISIAEVAFHLGLVLVDLGRPDEAEGMLARADREPVFRPGVAMTRARILAARGRWTEALDRLREARQLEPRELWVLLEFSLVAQRAKAWDQAEEALRWAILSHRNDPSPYLALVEMFLARGERESARRALDDYVRVFGVTQDAERMSRALTEPLDRAGR